MTYKKLQDEMLNITGLLFTHPVNQDDRASEIWIKFRESGYYVFINFEQPFPKKIEKQKLVGAGNSLNCSEYKKDNELIQYSKKSEVLDILDNSIGFRGNINDTIETTKRLFDLSTESYLHY
jgi:hypothetical protein